MTDFIDRMEAIKTRNQDAIDRFYKYYEPYGLFNLPTLEIGVQSFALNYDEEGTIKLHGKESEPLQREWLGWMLCAALKNLVDEHVAAERERCARCAEHWLAKDTYEAMAAGALDQNAVAHEIAAAIRKGGE